MGLARIFALTQRVVTNALVDQVPPWLMTNILAKVETDVIITTEAVLTNALIATVRYFACVLKDIHWLQIGRLVKTQMSVKQIMEDVSKCVSTNQVGNSPNL